MNHLLPSTTTISTCSRNGQTGPVGPVISPAGCDGSLPASCPPREPALLQNPTELEKGFREQEISASPQVIKDFFYAWR